MEYTFFGDLSVVIVVAAAIALFFSRYNLPQTVGYILAGLLIGPHVPFTLISDPNNIQMLSDLGVMFLMFSIGLGFSFRKVRALGAGVVFPACYDVAFTTLGGYILGQLMGWNPMESFILGLVICDSSTSIAAKTLDELGWMKYSFADSIFAIALIEDVLAIVLIAMLNGVATGQFDMLVLAKQSGSLILFLVGVIVVGLLTVPRLLNRISLWKNEEVLLMTVLALCFGVSFAAKWLDLSLVLGAFLSGAIISEARSSRRIEKAVKPLTNLFSAVFFVSVGLQVVPSVVLSEWWTVILVTLGMIFFKLVNGCISCLLICKPGRDAFKIGIGLGQVAEFAFIIAAIGMEKNLTERPLYQISVGVALLCTAINPYLLRYSDRIYTALDSKIGNKPRELLNHYRYWYRYAQESMSKKLLLRNLKTNLFMLGIQLSLITAFFILMQFLLKLSFVQKILGFLQKWTDPLGLSNLIITAGVLLFTAPLFHAAYHSARKLVQNFVQDAFSFGHASEWGDRFRAFIGRVLFIIVLLGLLMYTMFLCSLTLLDKWYEQLVLVGLLVLFLIRFSKQIREGYRESHATLERVFDSSRVEENDEEEETGLTSILSIHTRTIRIPLSSPAVGKTLGELNVRAKTGVSIITIYSANATQISPGRDTQITAGDQVIAVGKEEELVEAEAYLVG